MAVVVVLLILTVGGGPTITMPSVSGGLLAWIHPGLTGLLAGSFHQRVGTWADCISSRALVIDCDSLPVLYFTLTSWHAFLEKWMATGLNRVPLFGRIWLVRILYIVQCVPHCCQTQNHISNNNKAWDSSGILWMIWCFTKLSFHIPLKGVCCCTFVLMRTYVPPYHDHFSSVLFLG